MIRSGEVVAKLNRLYAQRIIMSYFACGKCCKVVLSRGSKATNSTKLKQSITGLTRNSQTLTQLNTERYRSGHNGADSKKSSALPSVGLKILDFLPNARVYCIFLEFCLQFRKWASRILPAKTQTNLIRRDIEVVITGLTRKVAELITW